MRFRVSLSDFMLGLMIVAANLAVLRSVYGHAPLVGAVLIGLAFQIGLLALLRSRGLTRVLGIVLVLASATAILGLGLAELRADPELSDKIAKSPGNLRSWISQYLPGSSDPDRTSFPSFDQAVPLTFVFVVGGLIAVSQLRRIYAKRPTETTPVPGATDMAERDARGVDTWGSIRSMIEPELRKFRNRYPRSRRRALLETMARAARAEDALALTAAGHAYFALTAKVPPGCYVHCPTHDPAYYLSGEQVTRRRNEPWTIHPYHYQVWR